MARFVAVEE
nr:TPA_asm: m70.5 sORF 2 [Murid betaherpesvirus 1]DBA07817.1 TPA_asm: m70.5 sORF 2 [Murid betaherpesvirus 1]